MGLKRIMPATWLGMIFSMDAYKAIPAPLPKPTSTTRFQSRPVELSLPSIPSTMERPRSSTSWSMSRSSFSKDERSRRYQEPSTTSGALRLNSCMPSPAGCWDQDSDIMPAVPNVFDKSLRTAFSALGLSPTQTTSEPGFFVFPASIVLGSGPSGLVAATLWPVKRRLSHSAFSLSRSSSSLRLAISPPPPAPALGRARLPSSSPALASSSWSVGKIRTTCALSEASAARVKASVMASSPTL
mmetsp:Transcript_100944/g.293981  ORF Transcript_100944/g.293981 Transcript_100944/m.293981 type:complete len:242 (-) Transcript_100944:318-1043(-)